MEVFIKKILIFYFLLFCSDFSERHNSSACYLIVTSTEVKSILKKSKAETVVKKEKMIAVMIRGLRKIVRNLKPSFEVIHYFKFDSFHSLIASLSPPY